MSYKVKDIKKIYENKLKMLNENIKNFGEMDRAELVKKYVNTFNFINEQVDILEDNNVAIEYVFENNNLTVYVNANGEKYSYSFSPEYCDIKKDKLLNQTGNMYLNMILKQNLIEEINNINLTKDVKLNYNINNKAIFTSEYSLVGEYDVNLKKDNKEYKLSKDALKMEVNEVPAWVANELENKKCKKLFRRR